MHESVTWPSIVWASSGVRVDVAVRRFPNRLGLKPTSRKDGAFGVILQTVFEVGGLRNMDFKHTQGPLAKLHVLCLPVSMWVHSRWVPSVYTSSSATDASSSPAYTCPQYKRMVRVWNREATWMFCIWLSKSWSDDSLQSSFHSRSSVLTAGKKITPCAGVSHIHVVRMITMEATVRRRALANFEQSYLSTPPSPNKSPLLHTILGSTTARASEWRSDKCGQCLILTRPPPHSPFRQYIRNGLSMCSHSISCFYHSYQQLSILHSTTRIQA